MTQLLSAGEIGRLNTASDVSNTDTVTLYQNGVLRTAPVSDLTGGVIKTAQVTLTSAQILALNATPISVLAAPGAGLANVIVGVYATKAAGTAYADVATGDDIAFKYTNASGGIGATLEMTGFADSASATQAYANGAASPLPVANAAIVAHMLTGEITTGNSPFLLTILYRTFPVPAF